MDLSKIKYIVFLMGCLLVSIFGQAQVNENANRLYLQWQISNCGINEERALVQILVENASVLEPLLLQGFNEGPPESYIKEVTAAELERMRMNKEALSNTQLQTGLSEEDLKIAREMKMDSAEKNIQVRVIGGWKTRALTGLSYIKSKTSNELIEKLASDTSSEFNFLAKSLLEQSKDR